MLFSKKQGQKFCLFTGCAASKTRPSNKDYECLPYEPTEPKKQQQKQEQPTCEPTPAKVQSTQNRASLRHLNKLLKQKTGTSRAPFAPVIESTRVEQSLVRYPAINQRHGITARTASTVIQRTLYRDSSQTIEPGLSLISEQSSCFSKPRASCTASFQPLYPSPSIQAESTAVYVCVRPYSPRHQGDIPLRYSERVHVLHVTDDYVFVKLIGDRHDCGYVAASSLLLMSDFMKRI